MTLEECFAQWLARDPSRPYVTFYDEATGERTELSARSLANWVAKTHYLLTDELGLGVGDTALIALDPSWISVPILLGCLTAGLALTDDPTDDAAVAFVTPPTASTAAGILDVYAVASSTAAFGLRDQVPDGTNDYVIAVRPQGDNWAGVQLPATDDDPCLPGVTRGEAVTAANVAANDMGLESGGRLLSTRGWTSTDDWTRTLFAPLVVGASVVIVRNTGDASVVDRRAELERVTVRLT